MQTPHLTLRPLVTNAAGEISSPLTEIFNRAIGKEEKWDEIVISKCTGWENHINIYLVTQRAESLLKDSTEDDRRARSRRLLLREAIDCDVRCTCVCIFLF